MADTRIALNTIARPLLNEIIADVVGPDVLIKVVVLPLGPRNQDDQIYQFFPGDEQSRNTLDNTKLLGSVSLEFKEAVDSTLAENAHADFVIPIKAPPTSFSQLSPDLLAQIGSATFTIDLPCEIHSYADINIRYSHPVKMAVKMSDSEPASWLKTHTSTGLTFSTEGQAFASRYEFLVLSTVNTQVKALQGKGEGVVMVLRCLTLGYYEMVDGELWGGMSRADMFEKMSSGLRIHMERSKKVGPPTFWKKAMWQVRRFLRNAQLPH